MIKKIEQMGDTFNGNAPINFRGDTLLHYACAKDNTALVEYLLRRPEQMKCLKNKLGQEPRQLTKSVSIR